MKVAIQGEPGSNSHLATQSMLGHVDLLPCSISMEVFEKLARTREADAAVLPIENSLHGAVADHSDLLLEHGVVIVAELSLRIRHALMAAPGVDLMNVRRVLSHPVALSQCRRFFAERAGVVQPVPFYDTAGAVKHLMETRPMDAAAIAAPYAADIYGAQVLAMDLEDDPLNFTRFFLLARPEDVDRLRPAGTIDKMSIAFDLPHRPGSLMEALGALAAIGVDLTRIESRPVPGRPWEYVFFVDLRLPSPEAADTVLEALRRLCSRVVELGRYIAGAPLPSR